MSHTHHRLHRKLEDNAVLENQICTHLAQKCTNQLKSKSQGLSIDWTNRHYAFCLKQTEKKLSLLSPQVSAFEPRLPLLRWPYDALVPKMLSHGLWQSKLTPGHNHLKIIPGGSPWCVQALGNRAVFFENVYTCFFVRQIFFEPSVLNRHSHRHDFGHQLPEPGRQNFKCT